MSKFQRTKPHVVSNELAHAAGWAALRNLQPNLLSTAIRAALYGN